MQDANTVFTSLPVKHILTLSQCSKTNDEKQVYKNYAGDIHYLSLIGSLLFATQMWPDIQFSRNPEIAYLEAAKRILCYLKSIVDLNLILGRLWQMSKVEVLL